MSSQLIRTFIYSRIFEHEELMDYNDFMVKSGDVTASRAYEDDFM